MLPLNLNDAFQQQGISAKEIEHTHTFSNKKRQNAKETTAQAWISQIDIRFK